MGFLSHSFVLSLEARTPLPAPGPPTVCTSSVSVRMRSVRDGTRQELITRGLWTPERTVSGLYLVHSVNRQAPGSMAGIGLGSRMSKACEPTRCVFPGRESPAVGLSQKRWWGGSLPVDHSVHIQKVPCSLSNPSLAPG